MRPRRYRRPRTLSGRCGPTWTCRISATSRSTAPRIGRRPTGETATTRGYSYRNGRTFTSGTNSTWGHGILSLTRLFTPNGGLHNPGTGNPISGGIYGPLAGPVTGASITGVDYTGRDSGHGFAYPVARQNFALDAAANLSAVQAISGVYGLTPTPGGAYSGRLWQEGAASVDLTAAGNSVGAAASWFYVKLVRPTGPATIG